MAANDPKQSLPFARVSSKRLTAAHKQLPWYASYVIGASMQVKNVSVTAPTKSVRVTFAKKHDLMIRRRADRERRRIFRERMLN